MPENNTTRLTRVTIRGFKSIAYDRPVELLLGKVNLLLGANGAGKSTIVSFFKMLEYMMSGSLQRYINENGKSQIFLLVKKLDEKALKEWLEEYTLSELWEKNVIGGRPL